MTKVLRDGADEPEIFKVSDGAGFDITLMDIGATWLSCRVPLRGGEVREVLLGHQLAKDYVKQPGYLGAIVGRYANRIARARFELDGIEYVLNANEGEHQLHGGSAGFHTLRWKCETKSPQHVLFSLVSPAGDQGFPGNLRAEVEYSVVSQRKLDISITTIVDAKCPVNLTSHAYFNLDAEHVDARRHRLMIAAQHFLPVSDELIPTGEIKPVQGTALDFTQLREVGSSNPHDPQLEIAGGHDHSFLLRRTDDRAQNETAVELQSADGCLAMQLGTSYAGLQLYTGSQLGACHDRTGRAYQPYAGIALEPQYLPDSPNRPEWPQPECTQMPGTTRTHRISYTFTDGDSCRDRGSEFRDPPLSQRGQS